MMYMANQSQPVSDRIILSDQERSWLWSIVIVFIGPLYIRILDEGREP